MVQIKQMLLSYARAAIATVLGLALAGQTDPKKLALAFLAGFAGPILKALDPSAKEFGIK